MPPPRSIHCCRVLLALTPLLWSCGPESPAVPQTLYDKEISVSALDAGFSLILSPTVRGVRLVEAGQEGVDVRLEVEDASGVHRVFDAPARRAAGAERACWFDPAGTVTIRLTTEDRVRDPARRLRLRVISMASRSEEALPAAELATCKESQGALTSQEGAAMDVNRRLAAYQDAAKAWSALGQPARAAAAQLNAAWLLTRETREWTQAVALGKAARAGYEALHDMPGAARATLQIIVPRWELARRGMGDDGKPSPREVSLGRNETEIQAAIAVFDVSGDVYSAAFARNNLGCNYYYGGHFEKALELLKESANRFDLAGEGSGAVIARGNLYVVVRATGGYGEAAAAFDRLIRDDTLVANRQSLADILNNSAATHVAAGNYDKALLQFQQALATHDQSKDQGGIARSMIGLADTYLRLGYAAAARDYAMRSRDRTQGGEDEVARLLIAGNAQRAAGDGQTALKTHAEAQQIASNTDIGSDVLRVRTALELVQDAIVVQDVSQARRWIDEAGKYVKPDRRQLQLEFQLQRARVRIMETDPRELERAAAELSSLRGRFEMLGAPAYEVEVLHELARVQFALKKSAAAIQTNEQCLQKFAKLRLSVTSPDLRTRLTAARRDAYEFRVGLLLAMRQSVTDAKERDRLLREAMRASDAAQSGLVGAAESTRVLVARDELSGKRRELLAEIATHEHELASIEYGGGTADKAGQVRDSLAGLRTKYDSLDVRAAVPEASDSANYLADALRPDTAVLVFLRASNAVHRVVITREAMQESALSAPGEIEAAVRAATDALNEDSGKARSPRVAASLGELRRLLLGETDAIGEKQRWIIVNDSATANTPFAALQASPDSSQRLIERHDLSMALTVRDALVLARAADPALRADLRKVAIVFDPVFTPLDTRVPGHDVRRKERRFAPFVQLTGTAEEKEKIVAALPGSQFLLLTEFEATRDRVLAADVRGFGVLHFATHAVASDQWPYGSGLLLTGSDKSGKPLAGYVSSLDLLSNRSAAELVVLSACDTALGEKSGSENVAGLARAFLAGGARRVVAARWRVDDDATAALMGAFYRHQAGGASAARALSLAQAAMSSDPRGEKVWAAFVLYERAPPSH